MWWNVQFPQGVTGMLVIFLFIITILLHIGALIMQQLPVVRPINCGVRLRPVHLKKKK
jgi:hypothetical protein